MTPQGDVFSQKFAKDFSKEDVLVFLCGHYVGVDERVLEEIVTDSDGNQTTQVNQALAQTQQNVTFNKD